jgi:hypothetical protein
MVDRRMKKDKRSHGAGKPGRKGKPSGGKTNTRGKSSSQGKKRGGKQGKSGRPM